jgi:hypothetical protein
MTQGGSLAMGMAIDAVLLAISLWVFIPALRMRLRGEGNDQTAMRLVAGALLVLATGAWMILAALV